MDQADAQFSFVLQQVKCLIAESESFVRKFHLVYIHFPTVYHAENVCVKAVLVTTCVPAVHWSSENLSFV